MEVSRLDIVLAEAPEVLYLTHSELADLLPALAQPHILQPILKFQRGCGL